MTTTKLVRDGFDFEKYLSQPTEDYRLEGPKKYERDVIDMFYGETRDVGCLLPWPKTHKLLKFRPGETTIWSGINHHGKTLVTGQLSIDLALSQSERVGIASMEMLPKRTLWRMVRQAYGGSEPPIRYIKWFLAQLESRLWLFDHQGMVTPDLVLGTIRYSAMALGVKHFFIDSLMKCVRGEDDYNGQKDFIDAATALARDLQMHIHIVHHVRKKESEFVMPGKFDSKGSGSISDQVDNFITVFRNLKKEYALQAGSTDPTWGHQADAVLNVDKQRNGEWIGLINLWFDKESMTFKESTSALVKRYDMEEEEQWTE